MFLDTGHGLGNRTAGVWDSGATGSGVQEASVVREVAAKLLPLLKSRGLDARMAPDGSINSRCNWQRATLTKDDLFVSLHLNSGAFSGTSVWYAKARPELRAKAALASSAMAKATGLKDEGACDDSRSAVKKIGVLNANQTATTLLFELCRIGHADGVRTIREKGATAVASAIYALLGMPTTPPAPVPADPLAGLSPEARAAWIAMRDMAVYSEFTRIGTPVTTEMLAVFLLRLVKHLQG